MCRQSVVLSFRRLLQTLEHLKWINFAHGRKDINLFWNTAITPAAICFPLHVALPPSGAGKHDTATRGREESSGVVTLMLADSNARYLPRNTLSVRASRSRFLCHPRGCYRPPFNYTALSGTKFVISRTPPFVTDIGARALGTQPLTGA